MGNGVIDIYLKGVGKVLLSKEEEKKLAQRIERGDKEAKNELTIANLRLVVSIARHYRYNGLDLEDLVQAGNLGLMNAVNKFDWRRGCKFSTFATPCIRQSISKESDKYSRTIRLPGNCLSDIRKMRRVRVEYWYENDRWLTPEELAE